ncbi:MAG: efflux RND transporter periplasmic adaptor subunit [Sediminibacterium sp.]|nr:efflux RND transporter periplasmic adaptor subunit [Sediminibacterium sp.]MDP1810465.1 efflux RND transporter periplasmic adaptor subunit [Sediminibacterium sp.]MDP3129536.1 efflux RND transporter periplasmic adaptor subunit [Sediminibacterium sp.]
MQKTLNILIFTTSIIITSCGTKTESGSLAAKKAEIEQLKKDQINIGNKIHSLESAVAKLDSSVVKNENEKLVGLTTLSTQNFVHYIDLQGRIDAENISYISPRLGGGQVRAIYIKKGDHVKKGQLLVKLDDAIVKQQIVASKQNSETLRTQLTFAKDVYNRRNNLWKQGIGTEIDLISAKTNVETLEKQIKGAEESIKTQQEQLSGSNIYSDVEGMAEEVNVRVGELFTGFIGNMAQIKIVNTSNLKVITEVPENYSGKVKLGSAIIVTLPDINKTYNTRISVSGRVIDPNNRSFHVEAKLPSDASLRQNQIAVVKIQDYEAVNAIAIPVNTVGTDEKGKYVFMAATEGSKLVARKRQITIGELYNQLIEVKSGLAAGEQLITEGFQNIYDGQILKTDIKK